ncbi:MAG: glycosyltransferase [Candidatus Paceibacterota bacterium]|jgi:glycosyltransferase involved in cell wall biosynthesis
MSKIPCTVGILTLNCADSLSACLGSLKDFAEIIICDGNSTDETQKIAKDFGAKVIKQYDSNEPNLTCVMDKSAVREKNMLAASHDWYFFMDADDTLSPEVVEEIRVIVSLPRPEFLAYRLPTRIFLAGREIKYEATYPSYQLRLVHRLAHGRFKGPVHDHLVFDQSVAVGTLKNFYNFYWPKERVNEFWPYLKRYTDWEIKTIGFLSLASFLRWGLYRRLRTIVGYLLYRLPKMYLVHGFKNSMPLWIELTIVRYHFRILFLSIGKYLGQLKWVTIFGETLRGKDINRILANRCLREIEIWGRTLDIGSGQQASYYRFLKMIKWQRLTVVDINPKANPDLVLDIEKESWPFADNYYDQVLAFNIFEHLSDPFKVIKESFRVLCPEGRLIGGVPFLVNVHADPHDYWRFTEESLAKLFAEAGFKTGEIKPVGRGPFLAGYLQTEFLFPRFLKILILPLLFGLDKSLKIIKPKVDWTGKYPLSFVFIASK